jgi:hypothetical protein
MTRTLATLTLIAAACLATGCTSEEYATERTNSSGNVEPYATGETAADPETPGKGNGGSSDRPSRPEGGGTPF